MGSITNFELKKSLTKEQIISKVIIYFVVYSMSICLLYSEYNGIISKLIVLFSFVAFGWNFVRLVSFRNIGGLYYKIILLIFGIATFWVIIRGIDMSIAGIWSSVVFTFGLFAYLMPLILLLPLVDRAFIRQMLVCANTLCVIYLITYPIIFFFAVVNNHIGWGEMATSLFSSAAGFVLLASSQCSRNQKMRAILVLILGLFMVTLLARRSVMLSCLGYMFAAFMIYLVYRKGITLLEKSMSIVISLVLLGFVYAFFMVNTDQLFSGISGRITDNTREEVLLLYTADMDENPRNWIVGKGIEGSYYAPGVDFDSELDNLSNTYTIEYRTLIECGYLMLVLKGGIVYLLLYWALFIPAIVKGFFYSNNLFSKGCAAIAFLWLIDMVPFGLPFVSIRYFIILFCVGICYSKRIRIMNDEELSEYIGLDKEYESAEVDGVK